ncbi:MAG: multidrug ABC transporter ATP-binding protein [Ignavibacteriales bacterium CG_4_9_14_3_um_filter_34_10]|nr:MAG: multidrug ABC transporter ATP-binding protein [Ignavibacteriales bacterium CG_4_9_14_3_um_filter_34_10]
MNEIIRTENFYKSYGSISAVTGISFNVYKGEMFGLVGPDGAGKTTTIRALCGLINPTSGKIEIFSKSISESRKEIQNSIGYLSQKFSLYGDLTIDENIEFFADIHNVENFIESRNELLEFTRLKPFRDRLADKLSGGMKQKLALACSLIHRPKILFLDEPTTGVDPVSRRDFWKILSGLLKEGITIFMTTPYLDEAERCHRVALMNKGKILAMDTPVNIKQSINKEVIEIVCEDSRKAFKVLLQFDGIDSQLFGDRINVVCENSSEIFRKIKSEFDIANIKIESSRIISPSLENVFINKMKEVY